MRSDKRPTQKNKGMLTRPGNRDDSCVSLEQKDKKGIIPAVVIDCTKWDPAPPRKPEIDPEFFELKTLERAAEAMRYQSARLESWLSPAGILREWLRVCLRLAVALLIPGLLLVPLSLILNEMVECAAFMQILARNLLETAATVILTVFVIRTAMLVWRQWNASSRRRDY